MKRLYTMFILLIVLQSIAAGCLGSAESDNKGKDVIVFLPGVMGTQLRNMNQSASGCDGTPNQYGPVWIAPEKIWRLDLLYLNDQGNGPGNPCDDIVLDGRMNTSIFFRDIKPYETFIKRAEGEGFTVLDYPGYDWRSDLSVSVEELDKFIDAEAKGGKVFLVAHSMGGLLARAYVADQGRANKIERVVTVGTPYLGAPKMALAMASGQPGTPIDWLLDHEQIKAIVHASPGIQQLLPSAAYFTQATPGYYQTANGDKLDRYESTADYFVQQGYVLGNILSMATGLHSELDGFRFGDHFFAKKGKYYVLYAENRPTISGILEKTCWYGWGRCFTALKLVSGDDTTPGASADLRYLPESSRSGVKFCGYKGDEKDYKGHGDLFKDNRVIDDVLRVLKGEDLDCTPQSIEGEATSEAEATEGFREFEIWGNGRVQVTDGQGNFTGVDDNGFLLQNLAAVTYVFTDCGVILTMPFKMPSDPSYTITIYQTDNQLLRPDNQLCQPDNPSMQIIGSNFALPEVRPQDNEEYTAQGTRAEFNMDNVPSIAGGVVTVTNANGSLPDAAGSLPDADGSSDQLSVTIDRDGNGTQNPVFPDLVPAPSD